jgi:lambda repressor-like predicted transcriptional regulator
MVLPGKEETVQKTALAEYLANVCKEKNISLRGLSINAGLSPGTVHSIIYREYEPSIYSLNQLADYLGVKRQYLWKLAGLIEDKDLDAADKNSDPRINYYSERISALPEPTKELIISIIGDILNYHVNKENSDNQLALSPVKLKE